MCATFTRGSVYYLPRPASPADLAIMQRIDALHMDFPFAGSRMLRDLLAAEGIMAFFGGLADLLATSVIGEWTDVEAIDIAVALDSFWLVFGGCGSAVLAAAFPQLGIGFAGVSLAFGLTVLTMAYSVGHISGAHFNPAVTVGLWAGRRFPARDIAPYIAAQVVGAIIGAGVLALIASGKAGFDIVGSGLAANGYGEHSPGGYNLVAGLAIEFVLTAGFLVVILGSTDTRSPAGFAPIAIGLALTLIHLISIPVTNTSFNPARSTGPAIFVGGWALAQLWAFWVAPLLGGIAGGAIYRAMAGPVPKPDITGENI